MSHIELELPYSGALRTETSLRCGTQAVATVTLDQVSKSDLNQQIAAKYDADDLVCLLQEIDTHHLMEALKKLEMISKDWRKHERN